MTDSSGTVPTNYRERKERFAELEFQALRQSDRLANWRLWVFLTAVTLIVLATSLWRDQPVFLFSGFAAAVVSLGFFVFLLLKHHRIDEQGDQYRRLREINEHATHRLKREWKQFPIPNAPERFQSLSVARDLDLFGRGSLFQLVCTAHTSQGRFILASWLAQSSPPAALSERHRSIQELAPQLEWRQQMHAKGMALADEPEEHPILSWTSRESWITHKPWLSFLAKVLPLFLLALILLTLTNIIDGPWWLAGIAIHWLVTRRFRANLDQTLGAISEQEKPLRHYVNVFAHVDGLNVASPQLGCLKTQLENAYQGMRQLSHLATQADARGSIVHPLLQYLLLWDFHIATAMERWQATHGEQVAVWFQGLGELEALASFANLQYDEPTWAFPSFTAGGVLKASQLGHPLIASDARVGNDLTLGPPGHFLLITGSNMSGKSTLLRSIGLNVTLAQAGAPVCASSLELSSFQLATSMRVQDSLSDGTSFFMAELQRIKQVVQMADAASAAPGNQLHLLYLLDEILQGTNTEERQIIVQRVVAHLVDQGAIGAVTTHDFALAEIEQFKSVSQLGHFREEFRETGKGPQMTFDYQLREGVATTTNAIKLLEIIELNV